MPTLYYIAETPLRGNLRAGSRRIPMGQNITALHIDMRGYVVKVRALSKSRRGTSFTRHESTAERAAPGKTELKVAVRSAVEAALKRDA